MSLNPRPGQPWWSPPAARLWGWLCRHGPAASLRQSANSTVGRLPTAGNHTNVLSLISVPLAAPTRLHGSLDRCRWRPRTCCRALASVSQLAVPHARAALPLRCVRGQLRGVQRPTSASDRERGPPARLAARLRATRPARRCRPGRAARPHRRRGIPGGPGLGRIHRKQARQTVRTGVTMTHGWDAFSRSR